jgi:hypothetical protein
LRAGVDFGHHRSSSMCRVARERGRPPHFKENSMNYVDGVVIAVATADKEI